MMDAQHTDENLKAQLHWEKTIITSNNNYVIWYLEASLFFR